MAFKTYIANSPIDEIEAVLPIRNHGCINSLIYLTVREYPQLLFQYELHNSDFSDYVNSDYAAVAFFLTRKENEWYQQPLSEELKHKFEDKFEDKTCSIEQRVRDE